MNEQPEKRSRGCGLIGLLVGGGCLVVLLACGGFFAVIFVAVFGAIKSSEPYTDAVAKAKASPAVEEALGNPIEPGYFVTGNIETSGSSGKADMAIPISGPKGEGTLYVVAKKSDGAWMFETLAVEVSGGGDRINLLSDEEAIAPNQLNAEASVSGASLSEPTICRAVEELTKEPVDPCDTFAPDTPEVFCSVKLSNAASGTDVKSEWIYMGGEVADLKDHTISEHTLTGSGTGFIAFSLSRGEQPFPRGNYVVRLSIEGERPVEVPFKVE